MQNPNVKTVSELKSSFLEVNPSEVHRTMAHMKLPQKTAMLCIYKGELLTYAQAIDMREGER
ncbi:hypothetical protein [Adhaeribacter aquaticus]|uniref:hypothetical protein n=1 Tax=Adhaeribacter aquaticus TaxID=299567 RepID=UPI0004288732|nr:hypothetical protein [Adhaeribacter aquaticus]